MLCIVHEPRRARRAGPAAMPGPRGAGSFPCLVAAPASGRGGYWATVHTNVAVPETPFVSVAVTVTV